MADRSRGPADTALAVNTLRTGRTPEIAGVIVYGPSEEAAIASAKGLALTVIGERLRRGEHPLTGIRSDGDVVGFKGIEFEAALAV